MADPIITDLDLGGVVLRDAVYKDESLTVGGAVTVLEGTILARKSVETAITPDGSGNTGNGTVTAAAVVTGPIVPLVGAYNLECIEAVAEGGVFKLEDPNGMVVVEQLAMDTGSGGSKIFETEGMTFTMTDGGTDFIVGDKFSLTVAADGKMVPFEKDGVGGAQIPKAILTVEVVAAGAGDEPIRAMIAGEVRANKLIIDSDGDGSNVDDAVLDAIRDFAIVSTDVTELNQLDNR